MSGLRSKIPTSNIRLSQISKSDLSINKKDYQILLKEIMKIKYPLHPIDQAIGIKDKLSRYKNQNVKKQLTQYTSKNGLNTYRRVRGDGNCFFRAVGFQSIVNSKGISMRECFPLFDAVCLTCCYPKSIPQQFQKMYDGKFLEWVFRQEWQKTIKLQSKDSRSISRKSLIKILDKFPFLDFIMILYFRAVCLKSLQQNYQSQISQYLCGNQESLIRTYSEQSQGIVLHLCSKILNIKIYVYQIRQKEVNKYKYTCENQPISQIYLLFQNSHYDILEDNNEIQSQRSALKSHQYYSKVNQKLINGICIQCQGKGYVYEQNGLCLKCYESSLNNLINLDNKDIFLQGVCSQCRYRDKQVSQTYGMCKRCLQIQKKTIQKNQGGKLRHSESNASNSSSSSRNIIYSHCSYCRYKVYVDSQTGLCRDCQRYQQKISQNFFKNKQASKKGEPATVVPRSLNFNIKGLCKECKYMQQLNQNTHMCLDCTQKTNHKKKQNSYEDLRCRICRQLRINKNLVAGVCLQCKQKDKKIEDKQYYQWYRRSKK